MLKENPYGDHVCDAKPEHREDWFAQARIHHADHLNAIGRNGFGH
jgi:hypothetical protein